MIGVLRDVKEECSRLQEQPGKRAELTAHCLRARGLSLSTDGFSSSGLQTTVDISYQHL